METQGSGHPGYLGYLRVFGVFGVFGVFVGIRGLWATRGILRVFGNKGVLGEALDDDDDGGGTRGLDSPAHSRETAATMAMTPSTTTTCSGPKAREERSDVGRTVGPLEADQAAA